MDFAVALLAEQRNCFCVFATFLRIARGEIVVVDGGGDDLRRKERRRGRLG